MPTTDYRSLRTRADLTMLMLGIYIPLIAVIVLMNLNQISLLDGTWSSGIMAFLYAVNYVAIVVTLLMWMHRASSNLRSLGVENQKYSPRAAVLWWFVPIAWWWMPYRVLREIYQGSQPVVRRIHPAFTAWWWMWLGGAYLGSVITRAVSADSGTAPASYVTRDWITVLSNLLLLVTAWFLFEIVRRTTEYQERKFELTTQQSGANSSVT